MNTMKSVIPALLLALAATSCSTEVELEADWKDIPVVYAFLSLQDTAHYVRVQKVFVEPGGNALQIAQNTDSIYYQNAAVEMTNVRTGETLLMERVDGADEGYPKEEGLFANAPNVLYKIKADAINFQGGDSARLVVNRGEFSEPAFTTTRVLDKIDTSSNPAPTQRIGRLRYTTNLTVTWIPSEEAELFDITFTIRYRESADPENPMEFVEKSLEWPVAKSLARSNPDGVRESFMIPGRAFYEFLSLNIPPSSGEIRLFDGMDLRITAGGVEMLELVELSRANVGITSARNLPVYSNVEGGLGIFTSRYQLERTGIQITQEALDSLQDGVFTRDLNFK